MTEQSHVCSTDLPDLSKDHLTRVASLFRLLGDEGRLRLVMACLDIPQPVCCLSELTGMSQPLTSHHLRGLREARILKSNRKGKQVLYELDDHHIRHVVLDLCSHVLEECQNTGTEPECNKKPLPSEQNQPSDKPS